LEIKRG